jgi:replicative DNA helicase
MSPLPHNLDAEAALLGAIFINNRAYDAIASTLRAEHFYHDFHAAVFDAVSRLIEEGRPANPITVRDYLADEYQDTAPLAHIAASAVTIINAGHYGRHILDLAQKRELLRIGEDLTEATSDSDPDTPAAEIASDIAGRLDDIAGQSTDHRPMIGVSDAMSAAIDRADVAYKAGSAVTGVPSGLSRLDGVLGGFHGQDLTVIAGATSMGKTALAVTIARNAAGAGCPTAFFSLEMSAGELGQRALAMETGIGTEKLRRGDLKAMDFEALGRARAACADLPLTFDDNATASVRFVRQRARRIQRRQGLKLIVVDYLQLLVGAGRVENRTQEVAKITRDLKCLAKDLDVAVVALSQLSRAIEQREDRRPRLSDLRESGSIEQDADNVVFVYRPEYYLDREEPRKRVNQGESAFEEVYRAWTEERNKWAGVAEIIVAKNRHGPAPKTARVSFDGSRSLFFDTQIREETPMQESFLDGSI